MVYDTCALRAIAHSGESSKDGVDSDPRVVAGTRSPSRTWCDVLDFASPQNVPREALVFAFPGSSIGVALQQAPGLLPCRESYGVGRNAERRGDVTLTQARCGMNSEISGIDSML